MIRKRLRVCLALIVLGVAIMFAALLVFVESTKMEHAPHHMEIFLGCLSVNDDYNITTWVVRETQTGWVEAFPIEHIVWHLEENDTALRLNMTTKPLTLFTDETLRKDPHYQLYLYDKNNDGCISKSDILKVKAPRDGVYILSAGDTRMGLCVCSTRHAHY